MAKEKVLGVIPARFGSTRIPGKMLELIDGKPLIQRTYERTLRCESLDALIITTDSQEIKTLVESLGAKVIMTPSELPTGTDRVSAAIQEFTDFDPDIVVNVWGDEPVYTHKAIDDCVQILKDDPSVSASTALDNLSGHLDIIDEDSIVKVATDLKNNILYLSRSRIPYHYDKTESLDYYHIIGVVAFRADVLKKFVDMDRTPLERMEGVEQLRLLENGHTIRVVKDTYNNLGVNMPDELEEVRRRYKAGEVT